MALSAGDCRDQDGELTSFPASPSVGPHSAAQTATDSLTDAGKPKVQIDSQSRRALKTDSTLRFLYKARVTLDSRLSRPAIALADSLVETFCRALLQSISGEAASGEGSSGEAARGEVASGETASGEAATVDKRLLMVYIHRHYILICFDLFLEECDLQLRKEVEQSDKRPIYAISQKANVYRVRRWRAADHHVATRFTTRKAEDKGELPYFSDALKPPVYQDGVRLVGFYDVESGKIISISEHTEGQ